MIRKIKKGFRNPTAALKYISSSRFFYDVHSFYHRRIRSKNGIQVMNQEWDTLVILDACRYDVFKQTATLPGELSAAISQGSSTIEFLTNNFTNPPYYDTVYVTANPHVDTLLEGQFHKIVNPWKTHWNEEYHTVTPETMQEVTKRVHAEYPDKRVIAHFMQPHQPFIGDARNHLDIGNTIKGHRRKALGKDPKWEDVGENIYNKVKQEGVDPKRVKHAYRENLEEVLPAVNALVDSIDGNVVVTADHGNLFEDKFLPLPDAGFPHPGGVYLRELVEVPWLYIDGRTREIQWEEPTEETELELAKSEVELRLEALGYKQE